MIKRLVVFLALFLFSSMGNAAVCLFPGAVQIPANSTFAVGPNVFAEASTNPDIVTMILDARDAWDVTDAVDRIGDWDNTVTTSDCPAGQPTQIGAFAFTGSTCATNIAYNVGNNVLAYVDAFPTQCTQCGTMSISVNLDFAWSTDLTPLPGEYDIQSVLAHEFGHVLGIAHHISREACV